MCENKISCHEIDFLNCGKFIILFSEKLDTNDVSPIYYTRQIIELIFGITKDDLCILTLRTHSEPSFKSFMLLTFISLILSCAVKSRLGKDISIEKAVSILTNLKGKVYDDVIIPNEVSKKQRLIFDSYHVLVPNFLRNLG